MPGPGYRVRLDPWAAEYEGAIQIGDEEPAARVDIRVERAAWTAIRPTPALASRRTVFVDGVRRIEHRLLIENGERTVFGLLGSYGVGAAIVDGSARVAHDTIGRAMVIGGGLRLPRFEAVVSNGRTVVAFEPASEPENTPVAPVQGLQTAMRKGEADLAERLSADADVVFLDGPLTYLTASARGPVVGYVKRLLRSYLDPSAAALLPRLAAGERTPLFLVEGQREPRYSWYLRLARPGPIQSSLAGIVRLETSAARGSDVARSLADSSARDLPRFASDATRDPRAPQNLVPIGALEARLRHRLGDPTIIRRSIEARLHQEVTA